MRKKQYGKKSQKFVKDAMHKFKLWKLKSWKNWKIVRNPKQAIAIWLSEARKESVLVPNPSENRE
jgi:hypothetical protein